MRGKEYLAAIFAEGGTLRAVTMRFADELRTPRDVGLPPVARPSAERRQEMERAARRARLSDELDPSCSTTSTRRAARARRSETRRRRATSSRSRKLRRPRTRKTSADVIDIMARAQAAHGRGTRAERAGTARAPERAPAARAPAKRRSPTRARRSSTSRPRSSTFPGRSAMSREELIAAMRKRQADVSRRASARAVRTPPTDRACGARISFGTSSMPKRGARARIRLQLVPLDRQRDGRAGARARRVRADRGRFARRCANSR